MKTILKFTVTVAFMCIAAIGMANEPNMYVSTASQGKRLVFNLKHQAAQTDIRFMDTEANVIFAETITRDGVYSKKFNLSKLQNGMYYITVENALKRTSYPIHINGNDITIGRKTVNSKPVFRTKGNMVYLNLLNTKLSNVSIKIYDNDGRLVFKEKLEEQLRIEKVFNFEKALGDSYTVMVKDGNDIYYQELSIE